MSEMRETDVQVLQTRRASPTVCTTWTSLSTWRSPTSGCTALCLCCWRTSRALLWVPSGAPMIQLPVFALCCQLCLERLHSCCLMQTCLHMQVPLLCCYCRLNAAEMYVDVSKPASGVATQWIAESGVVDLFLLVGPRPADVSAQYATVTGGSAMPQLFALGCAPISFCDQLHMLCELVLALCQRLPMHAD